MEINRPILLGCEAVQDILLCCVFGVCHDFLRFSAAIAACSFPTDKRSIARSRSGCKIFLHQSAIILIRFIIKAALTIGAAWLVAQCALSFLPGAFAQAPARIARGTRLISAAHAILPEARPARDGLMVLYGATFATESASGLPSCPDTLAGVTVWIGDEPQPLRYVSPGAVILAPKRLTSWLVVRASSGSIYYAPVRMADVSPAILIAGGDETGNLFRTPLAVWRSGKRAPEPLTLAGVPASTDAARTQIAIEGTGWRHAAPGSIRATLGGQLCAVTYAGPSAFRFAGQDSLTIELPVALTARGPLNLVIEAAGQRSNPARVMVRD